MKKVLFISFDFHEEDKPIKSVAIATLEAYLKMKIQKIKVDSFSFNMNDEYSIMFEQISKLTKMIETRFDYICISIYAWNARYVKPLIDLIKDYQNYSKIIVGGYEVNSKTIEQLVMQYDRIDYFLIGYAEESLYRIIAEKDVSKILACEVKNEMIPEIYQNGIIEVNKNSNVRLETKRGCPGKCTFCAYRNNDHNKITSHAIDKVKYDLSYLNEVGVKKVNILDAMFSIGDYLEVLEYLIKIDFKPIISLQMKFEVFYKEIKKRNNLIDMLKKLNIELEFGLQSISEKALKNVERINDIEVVKLVIEMLNENEITYEVSIIRGLPGETVYSYSKLLEFLKEINCRKYIIYPLTLLSNTKLYDDRKLLDIKVHKQNGLEYVVSTISYSFKDYTKMIMMESY